MFRSIELTARFAGAMFGPIQTKGLIDTDRIAATVELCYRAALERAESGRPRFDADALRNSLPSLPGVTVVFAHYPLTQRAE